MPIRTFWDNDKKNLIRIVFDTHWDIAEFEKMIDEIREMRMGILYPVDIILDFSTSYSGYNLNLLSIMGRIERIVSNHTGITLLLKPPPYIKYLVGVVERMAPRITRDLYIVDSTEEAQELLEKRQRPSES
ncbi:MAG: hypothetical protein R3E39_27945 [Anaerolineae bacterium]